MSYYFSIIGTKDNPLFELEFGTSKQGGDGVARFNAEARNMNPFIVHSSLDIVDELQWLNNQMYGPPPPRFHFLAFIFKKERTIEREKEKEEENGTNFPKQVSQTHRPLRLFAHLRLPNPNLHPLPPPAPPPPPKHLAHLPADSHLLLPLRTLYLYPTILTTPILVRDHIQQ